MSQQAIFGISPPAFAAPAAYGDPITAILAVIALFVPGMPGLAVAWAFNIVGTLDRRRPARAWAQYSRRPSDPSD